MVDISTQPDWIRRQTLALERIADVLERIAPPVHVRQTPSKPFGEDALTTVTNELRRQWDREDALQPKP